MSKIQREKIKLLEKQIKELKEAIYLKCFECSCLQISEIINCPIKECSLYPFRPKTRLNRGKLYIKMSDQMRKVNKIEEE